MIKLLAAFSKTAPACCALLMLSLLLAGCGGGSGNSGLPPAEILASITVTPTGKKVAPSSPVQFTAIGRYLDGSEKDVTGLVTWGSSDSNLATISNAVGAKGVAMAVTPGDVNITATLGTITGVAAFTPTALNSLTVTPAVTTMAVLDPLYQFTATGALADGSSQDLTNLAAWSSSDNTVAFISPTMGAVYATKAGAATIKAVFFNMSATAAVTVLDAPI